MSDTATINPAELTPNVDYEALVDQVLGAAGVHPPRAEVQMLAQILRARQPRIEALYAVPGTEHLPPVSVFRADPDA